jgi:hypothetical protein
MAAPPTAKKPAKKSAKKSAAKKPAKKAAKKPAKKPAKKKAKRTSKCAYGKIPFLFAVAKAKRCRKGIKVGEVVGERGEPVGIEVRAVTVRCGRGNRKVRCGGVSSF